MEQRCDEKSSISQSVNPSISPRNETVSQGISHAKQGRATFSERAAAGSETHALPCIAQDREGVRIECCANHRLGGTTASKRAASMVFAVLRLSFESWCLHILASSRQHRGNTELATFPLALNSEPSYTCRTLHKTLFVGYTK